MDSMVINTHSNTRIKQLPQHIFNRIAAGEVVERPSSVVKELVENSIDAGASKVVIEIVDGGVSSIRVSDDGCGIVKEDLSLAFLAHATSKIADLDDLDSIATLGFRGEALASIASVSHIKVVSRTRGSELASWVELQDGEVLDSGECGSAFGTSIEVTGIFENVPARKKFLKRNSTEQIYITSFVEKLILSRPKIAFKYIVNNKVVYNSAGTNLSDAIYCIWGQQILDNLVEVKADNSYAKLSGYVSRVGYSKHNNTMQVLVVNGRVVTDIAIAKVVFNCFSKYLVSRQFPVFVLDIVCDYREVDANVHPNKLEIRFANKDRICGMVGGAVQASMQQHQPFIANDYKSTENISNNQFLYNNFSSISTSSANNALSSTNNAPSIDNSLSYANGTASEVDIVKLANIFSDGTKLNEGGMFSNIVQRDAIRERASNSSYSTSGAYQSSGKRSSYDYGLSNSDYSYNKDNEFRATNSIGTISQYTLLGLDRNEDASQNIFDTSITETISQTTLDMGESWLDAQLVGSVFDTYIVLQDKDTVYFIDQHAAHEKILYDRLCEQVEKNQLQCQDLLLSYVFEVSELDRELVLDNSDALLEVGFEVREYGTRELAICSVPVVCGDINLKEFVGQMLVMLRDGRKLSKTTSIKKRLQQMACKSAIKGNQYLKSEEIKLLLNQYKAENCALFCPHGRPIVYTVTKYEMEKWFKRVV